MYHSPERLGAMNQISIGLIWNDDHDFLFIARYIFRERGYDYEHHQTFDTARAQWQYQAPTVAIIKRSLHTANRVYQGLLIRRSRI
jgi:hypothetical protein